MSIGKYKTLMSKRLWYIIKRDYTNPPPAWYYPTEGWITDPKEVERIMRERGLEI